MLISYREAFLVKKPTNRPGDGWSLLENPNREIVSKFRYGFRFLSHDDPIVIKCTTTSLRGGIFEDPEALIYVNEALSAIAKCYDKTKKEDLDTNLSVLDYISRNFRSFQDDEIITVYKKDL